ncbi:MAG: PAS domain S-box protein [Verrucomicrobia bacterium]|nr:PAS domain S-box protein [Verrucomicrobiota bacterium]
MSTPIKVLILDDCESDMKLMLHELRRAGYEPQSQWVHNEADFYAALEPSLDIILADYSLPNWTGAAALAMVQQTGFDIPFILVSGILPDEGAVELIKQGATDYLLKDRLARLGSAVARALAEHEFRNGQLRDREEFAASELRYRRLFEAARDGILIFSAETGRVLDVNPSLLSLLCGSREQFLGEKIWELPSFRNIVGQQADYTAWLRKGSASYHDDRMLYAGDGHPIAVEFVSNLYLVGDHPVIQCNIRDITERRRATALLAASEERYRKLFENSPDGIANLSPDLTILEANSTFARMHGYPVERMLGLNLVQLIAPASQSLISEQLPRILDGETIRLEVEQRHQDGHEFTVELTASLITVGGEKRIQACHRDISERKRLQQERAQFERKVQEAQRLESLGTMAGGIAHDFNNLMCGILLGSETIMLSLPAWAPEQSQLNLIKESALRAGNLCKQLLAYVGRDVVEMANHSLRHLVETTEGLLKLSIGKKTQLQLHLGPNPLSIFCGETQVRQVIMNFVINASEAIGDAPGVIAIRTRLVKLTGTPANILGLETSLPAGLYACLEVSDTGCGMSTEIQAKIFDPFFTTKFIGRGLGLAAVQGIVRTHKGGLLLDSKPGVGTTFTMFLPLAANAMVGTSAVVDRRVLPEAKVPADTCLLVVDDNDAIRETTAYLLAVEGFEVVQAVDGLQAVELFAAEPGRFDLVLMDQTMPRMNGDKAFIEMKRIKADLPVIIVSGYSRQELRERYKQNLPAGFLMKPFNSSALLKIIRNALETRRGERGAARSAVSI